MGKTNILSVKNLKVRFSSATTMVDAVKGSSFSLAAGSTLGIVGESGSGKSVSALSIMKLIQSPPGEILGGEIWFDSPTHGRVNLLNIPRKMMQGIRGNEISMIFQEPGTSLNPVFTCGYQVMEVLRLHKGMTKAEARARTIELFQQVELPRPEKLLDAYPHQISGGQKQRVMIAMAIACDPLVLIADEPTTALDVTVQKSILALLKSLQTKHGMAMIFISHDLGVIGEIADEVLVMRKGEIVEHGDVLSVFESPKHPYTRGLLACRPKMDSRMNRLPVLEDFVKIGANGEILADTPSMDMLMTRLRVTDEEYQKRQEGLRRPAPILEVKHMKKYYEASNAWFQRKKEYVKAVDDVSFVVYPGETLGLVGESGCGKSTLARTILQLIPATAGEVYFKGQAIHALSNKALRKVRKDISIIFQDPFSSLNPRIPVGEAILEPMEIHGIGENKKERKERVMSLLKRVSLEPNHYYRFPHEFSGGQRQRICIARTLALNPRFIICDESVSALDVSVQAQVLNLFKELQEEYGFSYIFISHDLSVVKFMSDRMLVMKEGKVVESGDAEAIYANPQSDYTRSLIEAVPSGSVERIRALRRGKMGA